MLFAFQEILKSDVKIALRQLRDILNPLCFFILVVSLFPLAITPQLSLLREIAPGVIWVAALLATLLSLDRLFKTDLEEGVLEQFTLSPEPLAVLSLAKVFAHWLVTGLPLVLVSPLLAMMMGLSLHATGILMLSLLLGTPILSFVGAMGSALTVGLPGSSILLALLVLPLYIPVLIFGAGSVIAAMQGLPANGQCAWLAALLSLAIVFAPFAIAAGVRISVNY